MSEQLAEEYCSPSNKETGNMAPLVKAGLLEECVFEYNVFIENMVVWKHFLFLSSGFRCNSNGNVLELNYSDINSYLMSNVGSEDLARFIFKGLIICERAFVNKCNEIIENRKRRSER